MRFAMAADRLFRIDQLGFIHYVVLLGAAAVTDLVGRPTPASGVVFGILLAGWLFHAAGCLVNDIVDLPVDRTQPLRADDPLVRGDLNVGWALAASFATLPSACLLTWWMGGGLDAQLVLTAAFATMAIYNLWSKNSFFPPATDLIQGISWCLMAFWAGLILEKELTAWSWVIGLAALLYIVQINGVHASLRDLENDLRSGCITTAILLGSRPGPYTAGACPAGMTVGLAAYAVTIQLATCAVGIWAVLLAPFSWLSVLLVGALEAGNFYWLVCRVLQVHRPTWQVDFRVHLFLKPLPPLVASAPLLSPYFLATLLLAIVLPPLSNRVVFHQAPPADVLQRS